MKSTWLIGTLGFVLFGILLLRLLPSPVPPSEYRFGLVADLDKSSKRENRWTSQLQLGRLTLRGNGLFELQLDEIVPFFSFTSTKGRGMELSDLVQWDGMLLSGCDLTGIVYELDLHQHKAFPRFIIPDGNGRSEKPTKIEWMTVKDGDLYIGSIGKEWDENGEIKHYDPQWVHIVRSNGRLEHVNWQRQYDALREKTNSTRPGYMIHESGLWHPDLQRWVFLPRKVSVGIPYNEDTDEILASNILLLADERFENIEVRRIGELDPLWGFSSVALLPGRPDLLVATKVHERSEGNIASTVIGVFDLNGKFYTDPPWQFVAHVKYEGVEILGTSV